MPGINQEVRQFPEFVAGVSIGFFRALITDPEVFLLIVGGLLSQSRSAPLRGVGKAFIGWFAARQADKYVRALNSNLAGLVHVIRDDQRTQAVPNG